MVPNKYSGGGHKLGWAMLCNWWSVSMRDHPQAECGLFIAPAGGLPRKPNSPLPFPCPSPTLWWAQTQGGMGTQLKTAPCPQLIHKLYLAPLQLVLSVCMSNSFAGAPIIWERDVLPSILLITVSSCGQVQPWLRREKEVGTILSPTWNRKKHEETKKYFCTLTKVGSG